jgi:outer membrane protein
MKTQCLAGRRSPLFMLAVFVLAFSFVPCIGAEEYVNLEESVKRGLEVNDAIKAAQFRLETAEAQRRAARSDFGPSATVGYGYTRSQRGTTQPTALGTPTASGSKDLWTLSVNVNQPLFTGFRLLNAYQRARISSQVSSELLRQTRLDLILFIQTNFLELLKAREDVRSAEDSLARLRSQLKVSQAFFDVGLQPRLDVLQAESDVAQAEQVLVAARNAVATQQSRLNTLLDWPVDRKTEYVGTLEFFPIAVTLEEALATAEKNRPSLSIARMSVDISRADARIVQGAFYPQVGANFDYYRFGDDPSTSRGDFPENDEWRVGAALQWEIFNSFSDYHRYRGELSNVSRLEREFSQEQYQVSFEVQANLLGVDSARQRIDAARKGVVAAREGYRMAEARYKAQVGTITEVLDAQARLTSAEANLTQALADYQQAAARLNAAIGLERPTLGQN